MNVFVINSMLTLLTAALLPLRASGGPIAEVGCCVRDFGEYPAEQSRTAEFTVQNTGDAPLKLLRIRSTCAACLDARIINPEVPPGGAGTVSATVKGGTLSGHYRKMFFVETDFAGQRMLRFIVIGNAGPDDVSFQNKPEGAAATPATTMRPDRELLEKPRSRGHVLIGSDH